MRTHYTLSLLLHAPVVTYATTHSLHGTISEIGSIQMEHAAFLPMAMRPINRRGLLFPSSSRHTNPFVGRCQGLRGWK